MLRRLSALRESLLFRLTFLIYYYIPIALATINPFQRRSDIREEHAGSANYESGKYAVYVVWQPQGDIPWYVRNVLEAFREHQVNTIVTVNHPLTAEQLDTLRSLTHKVLVRGNKGLDFGAYKDSILYLLTRKEQIARLLLFNDSVFAIRRGLSELIGNLLSDRYQVSSAYENWELHYHFQSFCLSLSSDVVRNPKFVAFWRNYRPISIRRWCIDHGEVKLSETLRKVATRFGVFYRINDMLKVLVTDDSLGAILRYREFVPILARKDFPDDALLSGMKGANQEERALILQRVKEMLSDIIIQASQAHTGAFFFPKFTASPFMKRDLVFREQFTIYEVERMLAELGWKKEEFTSIVDEIRRRGSGTHLKGFRWRRFKLGLI